MTFEPNPHHRRAQLVTLTDEGRKRYEAALRRYHPIVNRFGAGVPITDLQTAHRVLLALRENLEEEDDAEKPT